MFIGSSLVIIYVASEREIVISVVVFFFEPVDVILMCRPLDIAMERES